MDPTNDWIVPLKDLERPLIQLIQLITIEASEFDDPRPLNHSFFDEQ